MFAERALKTSFNLSSTFNSKMNVLYLHKDKFDLSMKVAKQFYELKLFSDALAGSAIYEENWFMLCFNNDSYNELMDEVEIVALYPRA